MCQLEKLTLCNTQTAGKGMAKLKTKNVFIDTEVFDAANLNFESTAFKELVRLAQADFVKVLLTAVTEAEVQALIKREHTADPDLQGRMLGIVLDTELKLDCNIRRGWLIETNVIDRSNLFGTWRF